MYNLKIVKMKKVILFLFVAILATSCNAQDSKHQEESIAKAKVEGETTLPKGSWKVSKELDENGNVIRYDSIYTWSSSKGSKALNNIENDSLLQKMQSIMQKQFSMFKSKGHSNFTENDSIMRQFFSEDFFRNEMPSNFLNIQDIMKRMEAMRQQFFYNREQYIIPPESNGPSNDLNKKSI